MFQVPFGLAVAGDKIYISDWGRKAILSVSGGQVIPLMADVTAPMALFYTPVTKTVGESQYILRVINLLSPEFLRV